jgi:hypothetical protein
MKICPKAKECYVKNGDCIHWKLHNFIPDSCNIPSTCPACIEYKPEPQNEPQLYILPPKETQYYKHSIVKDPDSREAQLYDKAIQDTTVDAVYSSAIPIDIEKLAEKITFDVVGEVEPHIADEIKQAIEAFIKE